MPQKVVIVGAGPAGLLLAHKLIRRPNYHVEILERRRDPTHTDSSDKTRTYPISLQSRGLAGIRTILGLEAALEKKGLWTVGAALHSDNQESTD
jgi:kynurenine 3-monooxygenase